MSNTTTDSNTSDNNSPSVIGIAVAGVLVTFFIIVAIIVVFFILFKYSNLLKVHGGVSTGGRDTLNKTPDVELTSDKGGTVIYEDIKHKEGGLEGGVYDRVNDIMVSRYETVGGGGSDNSKVKGDTIYSTVDDCSDETYKLRHSEKRRKDQLQGGYSRIDCEESLAGYSEVAQFNNFSEADNPIYSDPDDAPKQILISPPCVSLQPKASDVPQEIQDSEYAVIGTTGAPEIPKKSDILVDYLKTKSFNGVDKKPEVSVSNGGSCDSSSNGGGDSGDDMDDEYSKPNKHLSQEAC